MKTDKNNCRRNEEPGSGVNRNTALRCRADRKKRRALRCVASRSTNAYLVRRKTCSVPLSASGQERTERSTSAADSVQRKKEATMARDKKAGCKLAAKSTANCSSHFCPRVAIDVQPVDRCEIKQPEKYYAGRISPPHLDS